jgi:predicted N-acetyltransferase YhbS
MNRLIRKATPCDAKAIWDVLQHARFLQPSYREEKFQDEIRQTSFKDLWVAENKNGKITSTMMVSPIATDNSGGRHFLIPIIVTKRGYRRKGFARLLLREATKLARSEGVEIYAYAENRRSCELLQSEGFIAVPGDSDKQRNPLYKLSPPSVG